MKLRKLARLCEHDELKAHTLGLVERDVLGVDGTIGLGSEEVVCPGGVFLPDDTLMALVNEQAEDEGLWFIARTAPEAYLQQELRRLHALIEDAFSVRDDSA